MVYMKSTLNQLTSDQKLALRLMASENIGAIVTKFGWTWPCTIEASENAAGEVVRILEARRG